MSTKVLLAVLLSIVVLLSACGGGSEEPTGEGATSRASAQVEVEDTMDTGENAMPSASPSSAVLEEPIEVATAPTETHEEAREVGPEVNGNEYSAQIDWDLLYEAHLESMSNYQEDLGDFELSDRCFDGEESLETLDPRDGIQVEEGSPFPIGVPTLLFQYSSETGDEFQIYVGGRYVDENYDGEPLKVCLEAAQLLSDTESVAIVEDETSFREYKAEVLSALYQYLQVEEETPSDAIAMIASLEQDDSLAFLIDELTIDFPELLESSGTDMLRLLIGDLILEMVLVDLDWLPGVDANEIVYLRDAEELSMYTSDARSRWQEIGMGEESFSEAALSQWLRLQPLYFTAKPSLVDYEDNGLVLVSAVIDPEITADQPDDYVYGEEAREVNMTLTVDVDNASDWVYGSISPEDWFYNECGAHRILGTPSRTPDLHDGSNGTAYCLLKNKSAGITVKGGFSGTVKSSGPAKYTINPEWVEIMTP